MAVSYTSQPATQCIVTLSILLLVATEIVAQSCTRDDIDCSETSRPDWHYRPELNRVVEAFHERYAKQPDSTEAKQKLLEYLKPIRAFLEEQGVPCKGFQYVGSTYEGLKVDDGLEFDIFVVLDGLGFDVLPTESGDPDYNRIKPRPGVERDYFKSCLVNGYVSAEKIARKFQGYMDTLYHTSQSFPKHEVKFRKHGPAIQMDVSRYGNVWFSVDLVPTYHIADNFYVAKHHGHEQSAWLHSFSVEMKTKLETIDRDNGHRKQVLRVLKALCHRESTLKHLSSHHLKMLLFAELKKDSGKTWRPNELAVRLLDLIKRLQNFLDSGHYPHFFLPKINMFGRLADSRRDNMARRLEKLYTSEVAFRKVIS